jgi:uncharacterized membrane protein
MPETTSYLLMGLALVGFVIGFFIFSLFLRFHHAQLDITALESLDQ